jgi:hypothetical protein
VGLVDPTAALGAFEAQIGVRSAREGAIDLRPEDRRTIDTGRCLVPVFGVLGHDAALVFKNGAASLVAKIVRIPSSS